jgi:hypothetical protein
LSAAKSGADARQIPAFRVAQCGLRGLPTTRAAPTRFLDFARCHFSLLHYVGIGFANTYKSAYFSRVARIELAQRKHDICQYQAK